MATQIDINGVLEVLPHRFPFVLIDRVLEVRESANPPSRVGRAAVAIKNVTMNEQFFVGHFPGRPVMPGVLIVEAMAQAGCMAFKTNDGKRIEVAIAAIRDARFRKPVIPGDTLLLKSTVVKDRGQMVVIQCTAEVEGQLVAEAEILASISFI